MPEDSALTDAQQRVFAINIASALHRDVIRAAPPEQYSAAAADPADAVVTSAEKIHAWLIS